MHSAALRPLGSRFLRATVAVITCSTLMSARGDRAVRGRDRWALLSLSAGFLAVAGILAAVVPSSRSPSAATVALLVAVYALTAAALGLPLIGLLAIFARERSARIDHALELSGAYRQHRAARRDVPRDPRRGNARDGARAHRRHPLDADPRSTVSASSASTMRRGAGFAARARHVDGNLRRLRSRSPMVSRGVRKGVLSVWRSPAAGRFDADEVQLVAVVRRRGRTRARQRARPHGAGAAGADRLADRPPEPPCVPRAAARRAGTRPRGHRHAWHCSCSTSTTSSASTTSTGTRWATTCSPGSRGSSAAPRAPKTTCAGSAARSSR